MKGSIPPSTKNFVINKTAVVECVINGGLHSPEGRTLFTSDEVSSLMSDTRSKTVPALIKTLIQYCDYLRVFLQKHGLTLTPSGDDTTASIILVSNGKVRRDERNCFDPRGRQ